METRHICWFSNKVQLHWFDRTNDSASSIAYMGRIHMAVHTDGTLAVGPLPLLREHR